MVVFGFLSLFIMAAYSLDSESLFSLKPYHVSEELGFILPDPLVSGKTKQNGLAV